MSQPEPAGGLAADRAQSPPSSKSANVLSSTAGRTRASSPSPSRPLVPPAPRFFQAEDVRRLADDRIARFMPDSRPDRRRDRHRSSHDVQVGDTVTFLGTPHLITSIEEHPSAISRHRHDPRRVRRPRLGYHDRRRHLRSSHRPADQRQQGSVVTLDLVAGVVGPGHRRDRPLDPPQGPAPRRPDPFPPRRACRSPLPVCPSARVERGPTGRPGPHRWSSLRR